MKGYGKLDQKTLTKSTDLHYYIHKAHFDELK